MVLQRELVFLRSLETTFKRSRAALLQRVNHQGEKVEPGKLTVDIDSLRQKHRSAILPARKRPAQSQRGARPSSRRNIA